MRAARIMMTLSILAGMLCGCSAQPAISSSSAPAAASAASGATVASATSAESSSSAPDRSLEDWDLAPNAQATADALNDILDQFDYKVGRGFDHNIFDDQYVYENLEQIAVYRTWKWTGPNFNESVVLLYFKDEKRFQPMNLGVYQGLRIRYIRKTQNPDVLSVTFEEDAAFSFGLTYDAKSFLKGVDYSISQDQIVDKFYFPGAGIYGMSVESYVNYSQQFHNCEVIDGKRAALRFELLETNGVANYPKGTEIVLPQTFEAGLPGEILLPHVKTNLSQELLDKMSAMEGLQSVTAEPMQTGANHGTRFIVTPKPGYTVSCGFDSEEVAGWESTVYLFAEKVK